MISVSILRAAGLTDEQIVRVIETEQNERMLVRREQNRKHQQNHRSRKQISADRADNADTKTNIAPQPKADDFEELWKAMPKRGDASNPKKPARESFARAVKRGVDPKEIIAAARRFHEIECRTGRAGTEKVPQVLTWLNQERWNGYPSPAGGDLPLELVHGGKLSNGVYVKADTPEWDAWCGFLRQQGKPSPPRDKSGGWRFETMWPPTQQNCGVSQ